MHSGFADVHACAKITNEKIGGEYQTKFIDYIRQGGE